MASPFMNMREVAELLRFTHDDGTLNVRAAREWADRNKLDTLSRDHEKNVLVYRDDVRRALRPRTVGDRARLRRIS